MSKTALLLTALLAGLGGAAQKSPDFVDSTGNFHAHADGVEVQIGKNAVYKFRLRGHVRAAAKDQGLELSASEAVGELAQINKKSTLRDVKATGGVHAVRTTTDGKSDLFATTAKYSRTGSIGTVDLSGPVRLINSTAAGEVMNARGSSGKATLNPDAKSGSPLLNATLFGPVSIDVTHVVSGGQTETIHATGSRLTVDNARVPRSLTLSGGVTVDGAHFGHFTGGKAVMLLNDKDEVESVSVTRENQG